ncbi:MAG: asparagine synthase C-terminal domain-containing protein [Candidatus Woesearchaeota archaeon]
MQEPYIVHKTLIEQQAWLNWVDNLTSATHVASTTEVYEQLNHAVARRTNKNKQGVLFSGGIDSAVIAVLLKELKVDVQLFVVAVNGFPTAESEDLKTARQVSNILGLPLEECIVSLEEFEDALISTIKILPESCHDAVNVGIACVELIGIRKMIEQGIVDVWSGLGSEEIFAGYKRHRDAKDISNACVDGLKMMWHQDILREFAIESALKCHMNTPFLDEEVVRTALSVSPEMKVKDGHVKYVLRAAFEHKLGTAAWIPKRAAQYGSRTDLAITHLARKSGFKSKTDYIRHISNNI